MDACLEEVNKDSKVWQHGSILTQRLSHGNQRFPQYFYNCYVQVRN